MLCAQETKEKVTVDDVDRTFMVRLLEAHSGNVRHAVQLWQDVFRKVPNRSAVGIDVAMAFCTAGNVSRRGQRHRGD